MNYTIKAHPTKYNGVLFRSRLEARWAAFFDLTKTKWAYEPVDLRGWTPDFILTLPTCPIRPGREDYCSHVGELYVEVKPGQSIREAKTFLRKPHPEFESGLSTVGFTPALFGNGPSVTLWECLSCGGSSGGETHMEVSCRYRNMDLEAMWNEAGNLTQWRPQ